MARSTFSPERLTAAIAYLRAFVDRFAAEGQDRERRRTAAAEALGVTQPTITTALGPSQSFGPKLLEALAVHDDVSFDAILGWTPQRGAGVDPSSLPASPADRARLAARALGYAPDVIDSALATPPADADARALFRRIVSAESQQMAPPAEIVPIGRDLDLLSGLPEDTDDALAAEEARQEAEAEAKAKAEATAPPTKGKKR